jgi:hypothetical protein
MKEYQDLNSDLRVVVLPELDKVSSRWEAAISQRDQHTPYLSAILYLEAC